MKEQKLNKTRGLRKRQEFKRNLADRRERGKRNDIRPDLVFANVAIDELKPSPHRARKTTPKQLELVVASIAESGFCKPILVSAGVIVDGHLRLEAARYLGLSEIPVIECSHLPEPELRRLSLALNRTAELGEWDLDQLKIEFEELIDLDGLVTVLCRSPSHYATLASNASGLMPPRYECRRRV
ncbi:ParB N-terminal domain-containing protein, partial [Altererythrobacter sp. SALINAS58]|uniref:ParB/Srx family N-terminal domain-containing protein n=1 Tax=Alteripontixanthobacter muriae TaxID=2705546 RepID=UPI0015772FA9